MFELGMDSYRGGWKGCLGGRCGSACIPARDVDSPSASDLWILNLSEVGCKSICILFISLVGF